jgi:diguanylate cyclase (GGDEF)-like protein/PAS domain S-box-containing protein
MARELPRLARLLTWEGPGSRSAAGNASGVKDAELLVRVVALLQLTCAALAILWLVLPSVGTFNRTGMMSLALVAAALGAALFSYGERFSSPSFARAALASASLSIAGFMFFGGETATPFSLLYVIPAAAAVWFLSGSGTIVQLVWLAVTYLLAVWLAHWPGELPWPQLSGRDVSVLLIGVGGLGAEVMLIRMFKRHLVEGDQRLAAIVGSSQDAIIAKDRHGLITVWNHAAERLYGHAAAEVIGRSVSLLVPVGHRRDDREILDRVLAGEQIEHYRTERKHKDGSVVTVSLSVSPVYDAAGEVIGASTAARDVGAELRSAEQIALQARLLDEVDAAVVFTDGDGVVRYWNRGAERVSGYLAEEAVGRGLGGLVIPDEGRDDWLGLRAEVLTGSPLEAEMDLRHKSGRVFPALVRLRGVSLGGAASGTPGVITASVDITARRQAERVLYRLAEGQGEVVELARMALQGNPVEDLFGNAVRIASRVLGADCASLVEPVPEESELLVRAAVGWPDDHVGARLSGQARSMSSFALRSRESVIVEDWELERRFPRSSALASCGIRSSAAVPIGDSDSPLGALTVHFTGPDAVPSDCLPFLNGLGNVLAAAIRSRQSQEAIRHQALHDGLTGLPNRSLFLDRVAHALERVDRHPHRLAVLFVDLDHFKLVNDTLGHEAGDGLLRLVAERFAGAIRAGDTLARLGGDEFAVLCEELPSELAATRVAERLLASLEKPVLLKGDERVLGASVGIAMGSSRSTAGDLLRDADAALYHAKLAGRGRSELFDIEMRERVVGRVRIESALRSALADDAEIFLQYQPLVSLRSGRVVGAEALARWQHPEWGFVSPFEFIAVAEDSGLIHELGAHVIRRAARECAAWQHHRDFAGVAVNVSTRQLVQPDEVYSLVASAIAAEGIASQFFTLEITESLLIEHLDRVLGALKSVTALGVHLSLDDFGTGYSSLSYLRDLPLDSVKIDRSLISNIIDSPRAADLAAAIVDMAHALDLRVVGEGVETVEQAVLLHSFGCDIAQGYYFAKPMVPEQFAALLGDQPDWLPESVRPGQRAHRTATASAGRERSLKLPESGSSRR